MFQSPFKSNYSFSYKMRVVHRLLGFFLAGIMTIYALTGIIMTFRKVDLLEYDHEIELQLDPDIHIAELSSYLEIKKFKVLKIEDDILFFKEGNYNIRSGLAKYKVKKYPIIIRQMVDFHEASTESKPHTFFFNIIFGLSLFFFVISSFWMFNSKSKGIPKGIYYFIGGLILTIIILTF